MSTKLLIILIALIIILLPLVVAPVIYFRVLDKLKSLVTPPILLSNVLYPANPDPTGRNILFYSKEGKQILFSGMGVSYYPAGSTYQIASNSAKINIPSQTPDFVVGLFKKWQKYP